MVDTEKYPPPDLTPQAFEIWVKGNLDALGGELTSYTSTHRKKIEGVDGTYEIDVTCRFAGLGMEFLVLIECKRYTRPVEREKVQALLSKMQSTGAHKGAIFATSGFQNGAIEFAKTHGIALVEVADGRTSYMTRSFHGATRMKSWDEVPEHIERVVGWLRPDVGSYSQVSARYPEYLAAALGLAAPR